MHTVSIIIPTWNGLPLLQAHLPALLEADGVCDAELIIADDGSTDGTADWVRSHVPQARVVRLDTNTGFSAICNAALQEAQGEFVLLLNNDVRVTPQFLPPLIATLAEDAGAFAVNARILLPDGRDEGQKRARLHHGMLYVDSVQEAPSPTPPPADRERGKKDLPPDGERGKTIPTPPFPAAGGGGWGEGVLLPAPAPYATACAALFRRRCVMALGGFDTLFSPAYWEDADLCWRAWRRGWTVWVQPASVVYHEHQQTTGRMNLQQMACVRARNGFLFAWKNLPVRRVVNSLMLAPAVGLWHLARDRDPSVLLGYADALRLWRQVLVRRMSERRAQTVSNADVLAQWTGAAP